MSDDLYVAGSSIAFWLGKEEREKMLNEGSGFRRDVSSVLFSVSFSKGSRARSVRNSSNA